VAANRGSLRELFTPKFRLEVAIGKCLRENGARSIGSMAAGATGRSILVDLHAVLVDPVLSSNMHAVWPLRFGRRLHFVAVIAVPHDTSVLCVGISVARIAFQSAVSDGCAIGESLLDGKGAVRRLSCLSVFFQGVIEAQLRLGMKSCSHMAAAAIGRVNPLVVWAVAICAGEILRERRLEEPGKHDKD